MLTNGAELIEGAWDILGDSHEFIEDLTFYVTFDVHDSITAVNIVGEFRELSCADEGRALTEADGILEWGSDIPTPRKGTPYPQERNPVVPLYCYSLQKQQQYI